MGGYFMPTSVGGGLGILDVVSQGLGVLGPIIQTVMKSPTAQKTVQVAGRVLGAAAAGATVGAGSSITDAIIRKLTTGTAGTTASGLRKRRRLNVLNPRALRRSMRRVQGFSKFARKSFILEKRVRMKKRRR